MIMTYEQMVRRINELENAGRELTGEVSKLVSHIRGHEERISNFEDCLDEHENRLTELESDEEIDLASFGIDMEEEKLYKTGDRFRFLYDNGVSGGNEFILVATKTYSMGLYYALINLISGSGYGNVLFVDGNMREAEALTRAELDYIMDGNINLFEKI